MVHPLSLHTQPTNNASPVLGASHVPAGLERIISGGQTGADRAALDAAIILGIPHGGWCPAGRRAEDGRIPEQYLLRETLAHSYLVRTEWNVRDSDATVVFTMAGLSGGSWRTMEYARLHGRPSLHLELSGHTTMDIADRLAGFSARHPGIRRLNIAGSREASGPGIHSRVVEVLLHWLQPPA